MTNSPFARFAERAVTGCRQAPRSFTHRPGRRCRTGRGRARRALSAARPARLSGAPPSLGRNRRVLTAHALTQRALPRGRASASVIPAQSTGRDGDPGYAFVRLQVVRTALEAGLPLSFRALPKRSQLPPLLPRCGVCGSSRARAAPMNSPWTSDCRPSPGRPARHTCCAVSSSCPTVTSAGCSRRPGSTRWTRHCARPTRRPRSTTSSTPRVRPLFAARPAHRPDAPPPARQGRPRRRRGRRRVRRAARAARRRLGSGRRRRTRVRGEPGGRSGPQSRQVDEDRARRVGVLSARGLLRLARPRRPHRQHRAAAPRPSPSGPAPASPSRSRPPPAPPPAARPDHPNSCTRARSTARAW